MKNNIKTIVIIFICVPMLVFFGACNKTNTSPAPTGVLKFHIHTDIDTNEVAVDSVARDSSGRYFSLHVAEFYVSGVVLHKADGSSYALAGKYILKTIPVEEYIISDSVPAGNYVSVSFNVGLDPTANFGLPSSYTASNPLSDTSMWFNAATGHVFMNVLGKADTGAVQTGNANFAFGYQLGTSSMLETVNMPTHSTSFSVIARDTAFIHVIADYGKLFRGINFRTQSFATPFSNPTTAQQIANNIPSMFRYEE